MNLAQSSLFLNPALLIGSVLVAAPIVIHLLARRRFRRVRWAAMEFLLQADRQNRRRVRLQDLLLLLLRCLIVALLVLMVARPFVRPSSFADLIAATARTERILVLDDSLSMNHRSGSQSAFGRARHAAQAVLNWLQAERPDDPVTVLRMSRPHQPDLIRATAAARSGVTIREALAGLRPSHAAARPADTLLALRDYLLADPASGDVMVYFLSDFQQSTWLPADGSVGADGWMSAWSDLPEELHWKVSLVDVSVAHPGNQAVIDLLPTQPQIVAALATRLQARIANYSNQALEGLTLRVFVNDAMVPQDPVGRIAAGQTLDVPLELALPEEGIGLVRVQLPADPLELDDARAVALQAIRAIRVLIVNGEPAADIYRDETYVLQTALSPQGQTFSGVRPEVVDEGDFEGTELADFHAVILANVYRLTEPGIEKLEDFVAAGGGLAIFLGDQVDAELYNRLLYREGQGLLAVRLGDVLQPPSTIGGVRMNIAEPSHPLLRGFLGSDVDPTGGALFRQYITCEPDDSWTASKPAEPPLDILARAADQDATPLLLVTQRGRGRVVLFTSTVDLEWNTWALHPSFVVTMLELAQYLARPASAPRQVTVGSPVHLPCNPDRYETVARLKSAGGDQQPSADLPAQPTAEGSGLEWVWSDTQRVGVLNFELTKRTGVVVGHPVPVNPDPAESNLEPASRRQLLEAFGSDRVQYLRDVSLAVGEQTPARQEIWPLLLLAVVALLATEQLCAWWFALRS